MDGSSIPSMLEIIICVKKKKMKFEIKYHSLFMHLSLCFSKILQILWAGKYSHDPYLLLL